MIAQIAGSQVKEGIVPFILFMALLSINLAILNLLPVPVLDGGHLLFYLVEAVTGHEVNLRWREMAQQIGFVPPDSPDDLRLHDGYREAEHQNHK